MNPYLPHDATTAGLVAAVWVLVLAAGWSITRLRSVAVVRAAAWALVVTAGVGLDWLCSTEPAGVRMVALIVGVLFGMKAVVSVEAQAAGQPRLSPLRWLGFAALWVGMRPLLFVRRGAALPGAGRLLRQGAVRLIAGLGFLLLARWLWDRRPPGMSGESAGYLVTPLVLVGLSLGLHFGILNLLAGLWQRAGVDCRALFRAPLRSLSLGEFWGRRWNLAFTEMTAQTVYRPLVGRLGQGPATALAFVFSGLLHEMAISVPVRAGYGLPLLYFVLHGALVRIERRWERLKRPVERLGWKAHLWTLGWLALPLPLLFHPWFLKGVVWPMVGIGGIER